jgi:hypothetical protein
VRQHAEQLASALARLLDLVTAERSSAAAVDACRAECLVAERQLIERLEAGGDPRPARDVLERCDRLRSLLRQRTERELTRVGQELDKVRASLRSLPAQQQSEQQLGGSCNLSA